MNVVILEDAAEDLESGAQFYESCATGVGDYFFSVAYHLLARDNEYKNQAEDNRRRWKTIADGGFELYVIPGRHDTIREEPYVSYLAQKLRRVSKAHIKTI